MPALRVRGEAGPAVAARDCAVTVAHLRVDDATVGAAHDLAGLEPEGPLQPFERRAIIFVRERWNQGGRRDPGLVVATPKTFSTKQAVNAKWSRIE